MQAEVIGENDPSLDRRGGCGDHLPHESSETEEHYCSPYRTPSATNDIDNEDDGKEVFCGRIPREITEIELKEIFSSIGTLKTFRLPIDSAPDENGRANNRGFAFISYIKKEDADRAISKINGRQIRRRQYLKVTRSHPNTRLFIGNIPKAKSRDELFAEFASRTGGLKEVIIYRLPDDERKNRGFCFLEYDSYKDAAAAKRRLTIRDTKLWGCDILVDWADPQQEVDHEVMSKVRIIYARNISVLVTEDILRVTFSAYGTLERVKKIKDFAFIHFASREEAGNALNSLQGTVLEGIPIELQWAKPPTDKETRQQILRAREKRMLHQQSIRPVRGAVNPFPQPLMDFEVDVFSRFDRGDSHMNRPYYPELERTYSMAEMGGTRYNGNGGRARGYSAGVEPHLTRMCSQVYRRNSQYHGQHEDAVGGGYRPIPRNRINGCNHNLSSLSDEDPNWRSRPNSATELERIPDMNRSADGPRYRTRHFFNQKFRNNSRRM